MIKTLHGHSEEPSALCVKCHIDMQKDNPPQQSAVPELPREIEEEYQKLFGHYAFDDLSPATYQELELKNVIGDISDYIHKVYRQGRADGIRAAVAAQGPIIMPNGVCPCDSTHPCCGLSFSVGQEHQRTEAIERLTAKLDEV